MRHAAALCLKTLHGVRLGPQGLFGDRYCFGWPLRPSLQRGSAGVGQGINSTLNAVEPSIDIVEEDFSGVRSFHSEIPHAAWTGSHCGCANQCLLAIRCHDRRPCAAAGNWINSTRASSTQPARVRRDRIASFPFSYAQYSVSQCKSQRNSDERSITTFRGGFALALPAAHAAAALSRLRAGSAPRAPRWVGEPPPRPPANDVNSE